MAKSNFTLLLILQLIISACSPFIGKRKFSVDSSGKLEQGLWQTTIPYSFMGFNKQNQSLIIELLKEWERYTCLKFVPKSDEVEVMKFENEEGVLCTSMGGNEAGYGSVVQLESPQCISRATILHEIGHSLGLEHEFLRPSRSKELILSGPEKLEVKPAGRLEYMGLPYDVQSVMGYSYQSLENYKPRFVHPNKKKFMDEDRQEVQPLSFTDVAAINLMYKCGAHCSTPRHLTCPKQGFLDKNCNCVTPWGYAEKTCKNVLTSEECEKKKTKLGCFTHFMGKYCRKSCNVCYVYFEDEWRNVELKSLGALPTAAPTDASSIDGETGGIDGEIGGTDGETGDTDGEIGGTDGDIGGTDGEIGGTDGKIGGTDGDIGSTDGEESSVTDEEPGIYDREIDEESPEVDDDLYDYADGTYYYQYYY